MPPDCTGSRTEDDLTADDAADILECAASTLTTAWFLRRGIDPSGVTTRGGYVYSRASVIALAQEMRQWSRVRQPRAVRDERPWSNGFLIAAYDGGAWRIHARAAGRVIAPGHLIDSRAFETRNEAVEAAEELVCAPVLSRFDLRFLDDDENLEAENPHRARGRAQDRTPRQSGPTRFDLIG